MPVAPIEQGREQGFEMRKESRKRKNNRVKEQCILEASSNNVKMDEEWRSLHKSELELLKFDSLKYLWFAVCSSKRLVLT